MDYTSYQITSSNSQSLNTGSYLNPTEYVMFVKGFTSDLWYGLSAKDVIEVGLWDHKENQIGWDILYQSKSYDTVTVSYYNARNNVITYSYQELIPKFILNQTNNVLIDPANEVYSSFSVLSGSYVLTYNLTREMAGSPLMPLVITDIAPSRTELKLLPLSASDDSYAAFCKQQFLMKDVSPLYIQSLNSCPYGQIYNSVSSQYANEIVTIKTLFFIPSNAGMLTFFRNLYEDVLIYSSTPIVSSVGVDIVSQNLIRIQGIQTFFTNYLLSNSTVVAGFDVLDSNFRALVSASVDRKFASAGPTPSQEYVNAKTFVYDFFTEYFYTPISNKLQTAYKDKYFGYFKNALNLGGNRLLPILSTGMMDERTSPDDPLTLLVKLKDELPTDLPIQTQCWISNISLTPQIVSSIIVSNTPKATYQIGPPDFSIPIPDASLTNTNVLYNANDLKLDDETDRQITISQNINALQVDYTSFSNFVVFSSAEMRLKIFKNKVINLYGLSSSLDALNTVAANFQASSGSIYPYYDQEFTAIQGQMDTIVRTFDGYESYLYNGGNYVYSNGEFVSASYVASQDASATNYDTNNRDSLVNTCPEHILSDPNNDDYIIFISMIGHFFDNIYIYIANMPSEKKVGADSTADFTRKVVDYMLETFGWDLDNSLEQTDLINNYLTDMQGGLNSLSAEDRIKVIRNRILQNLPAIYKSKGTDEAVQLILGCYGIPSALLSVREYGGVDYDDPTAAYTLYERVYMRQWNTSSIYDSYDLQVPTGSHTYLFKIKLDDATPYTYGQEQVLFGRVQDTSNTSLSGSGEWAVGFVRIPKKNTGQVFFRIGYDGQEALQIYSPEFPLFDGNIYSIMLRRNYPDPGFDFSTNYNSVPTLYDLYVKRNQFGNQILALSSSLICYDLSTNIRFDQGGLIKIGGWFANYNGQGFTGAFDKFQAWANPISNSDLEDYTNNFNAYVSRGSGSIEYQNLFFRMHTDYPFDQNQTGIWRNGNPYFAVSSSAKLNTIYGEPNCNVDYIVSSNAWAGAMETVQGPCGPITQSVYPWQWQPIDYPSTWGLSKYGPNKFRNEKIKYVSQSLKVRLDDLNRSTYDTPVAPDSNQVGFFADPQDFKNRDIVRYFGNYDFMDAIGNPLFQYSQSYDPLRLFRKEFAEDRNQLSGSRTLFNELLTTYKLYFNRSIFDSIKNVVPARTNALVGVVIEPTILERPKYAAKPINAQAKLAFEVPIGNLMRMTASLIPSQSMELDLKYVSYPNRDYPVNYGGNYIKDLTDPFEFGHFAAGVPTREVDFSACPRYGFAPLAVTFSNLSFGANSYLWDFGDNSLVTTPAEDQTNQDINPYHTYTLPGTYTVKLIGYFGQYGLYNNKINYITVEQYNINTDFDAEPKSGFAPLNVSFNNLTIGATNYVWDFGSGSTTSTTVNPTQEYLTPGIYTVTLTAYTEVTQTGCEGPTVITPHTSQRVSQSYITVLPPNNNCVGPTLQFFAGGNFGVQSFAYPFVSSLGALQTPVTFSYNVAQSASRYVVVINGVTEYDTQWACTPTADQTMVNSINNALLAYGSVPTPSFLSASLTNVVAAQNNTNLYFTKTQASQWATVTVYNPFNTTCSFTMSCPTPVPPPYIPPTYTTYSCGTSVSGKTDSNGNPFPYTFGVKFNFSDDDLNTVWSSNEPVRIVLYYKGNPQSPFNSNGNETATFDGWHVCDTGYMGLSKFQATLNSALAAQGQGPSAITSYVSNGTIFNSFLEKQFWGGGSTIGGVSNPNEIMMVQVYAPIPNTTFTVTVGCPY